MNHIRNYEKTDRIPIKYLDLLSRAKASRRYIHDHPGIGYVDLKRELFPVHPPIMWLLTKGYIFVKGGGIGGDNGPRKYYAQPIGTPVYDPAPKTMGISGPSEVGFDTPEEVVREIAEAQASDTCS